MFDDVLAIIPARKGSKRLPGKNKAIFEGIPLWFNTVIIAIDTGIKNIVVSTDDDEISSQSLKSLCVKALRGGEGVQILKRSEETSDDDAATTDVILEVIHQLTQQGIEYKEYKTIALLQPTSPLLEPHTLKHALHQFQDRKMRCLIAYNQNYKPCGAFYIFKYSEFLLYGNSIYGIDDSHIYILPPEQAIDVDELWDWRAAQAVKAGRVVKLTYDFGI